MKNSKLFSILSGFAALIIGSIFFTACSKESISVPDSGQVKQALKDEAMATPGLFSKEIIVKDAQGRDALAIRVSGDDESIIEGFSPENFEAQMVADKITAGNTDETVGSGEEAGVSSFNPSDVHITVLKSFQDPGSNSVQLAIKPGTGISDRVAVEFWLHNSACNYSKVWASNTFYVEGYYCGYWPYWSKCCAGWRSNTQWVARGYCGNRSIHITQSNAGTLYWAFGN